MTVVRLLVPEFSIYLIVFLRLATQAILLTPIAFSDWNQIAGTCRFKLHFLRASLSVLGMALFYYAFANLPMATATTLTFTVSLSDIGIPSLGGFFNHTVKTLVPLYEE